MKVLKPGCHLICCALKGLEKLGVLELAQLPSFINRIVEVLGVTFVVSKSLINPFFVSVNGARVGGNEIMDGRKVYV